MSYIPCFQFAFITDHIDILVWLLYSTNIFASVILLILVHRLSGNTDNGASNRSRFLLPDFGPWGVATSRCPSRDNTVSTFCVCRCCAKHPFQVFQVSYAVKLYYYVISFRRILDPAVALCILKSSHTVLLPS